MRGTSALGIGAEVSQSQGKRGRKEGRKEGRKALDVAAWAFVRGASALGLWVRRRGVRSTVLWNAVVL